MRACTLVLSLLLGLTGLGVVTLASATPAAAAAAAIQVFPVPTSNAGLARIDTAPDGSMWFVEYEAAKVGRITPDGRIQEVAFPQDSDSSHVVDLDVAPDGTVWVVWDTGRYLTQLSAAGQELRTMEILSPYGDLYPYGDSVRVADDGTVWVTTGFDESGIGRVVGDRFVWDANAPECDTSLGIGRDGTPWCRDSDGLVQVGAGGAGGTRRPLPFDGAAYPYSIAPGPVGSIWFGRYYGGSWFTSPDDGSVGYLDAGTGQTVSWGTGDRTAPDSLVQGPDGNIWFTSIGAATGIGHVSATGRGAIASVGAYSPTALTFGPDGAVWFTDATNNVIGRVTTDQLQTTDVDVGEGYELGAPARPLSVVGKTARVRQGRIPVTLRCGAADCRGTVTVRTVKGRSAVVRTARFAVKAGRKKTVRAPLNATGKRLVRGTVKLKVTVKMKGHRPVTKVVRVRR